MRFRLLSLLLGACLTASCGYAPVRTAEARGLKVAAVRNATAQAEAGGIFAAALRSELAGRGRLDPEGSSAPEVAFEVLSLQSVPTASAGEGAASFRLEADLKLKVADYEDRFRAGEDYLAGLDVLGTEGNRRAALRRLARGAAKDALDRYEITERLNKK